MPAQVNIERTPALKPESEARLNKRWKIYALIGVLFGIFDFFYQELIAGVGGGSNILRILVTTGVWLIPAVPVVLYEAKVSQTVWKPALANVLTWVTAVIAYYLYMGFKLVILGQEGRPEAHISSYQDPYFWSNLKNMFLGDILGAMPEWLVVAVVGGSLVGLVVSGIYLGIRKAATLKTA
jgi:hypothetical protein